MIPVAETLTTFLHDMHPQKLLPYVRSDSTKMPSRWRHLLEGDLTEAEVVRVPDPGVPSTAAQPQQGVNVHPQVLRVLFEVPVVLLQKGHLIKDNERSRTGLRPPGAAPHTSPLPP